MSHIGTIAWVDLTVPDASATRDFYAAVTGWKAADVPMGDYSDYSIHTPSDAKAVADVCHARGTNADLTADKKF